MRNSFLKTALTAAILVPTLAAQTVYNENDVDRRASTVFAFGDAGAMVGASISYSTPMWQSSYDSMLEKLKGTKSRLGKNWWTTLSTMHPVEIAGKKLDAGNWFLGLECDKEGKFHLLAMEADMAIKHKFMPWGGEQWKNEVKIPLDLHKGSLEKVQEKMEIALHADEKDPSKGGFAIRWGTHELTAKVRFMGAMTAVEASAKKMEKKMDKKMDDK